MRTIDNDMLWRQFGAAIDMLGDVLRECPGELWEAQLWGEQPGYPAPAVFSRFWYLGYHALFWTDFYLTGIEASFAPPPPFDLSDLEDGKAPPRTYTRAELLDYFDYCRKRAREIVAALTPDEASRVYRFTWGEMPFGELQLDSIRHLMEHGAQLRLFLGQQANKPALWITRTVEE